VTPHASYPDRPASSSAAPSATARLVSCAAHGDQRAWDQLVERYSGLLWAVARAHRLTSVESADVVQTSWLRLVEHLAEIRNPDGLGAWLATTARRECLRALRGTARCEPVDDIETLTEVDSGDLDAGLLTTERDAGLRAAFERLPARDQALLRLLTADPTPSYEEIGAALAMPIGSIGPTRARTLERLRRGLRGTGVLDELAAEGRP
jgi:RNA polymerase sigma factor (sigma-70 family)